MATNELTYVIESQLVDYNPDISDPASYQGTTIRCFDLNDGDRSGDVMMDDDELRTINYDWDGAEPGSEGSRIFRLTPEDTDSEYNAQSRCIDDRDDIDKSDGKFVYSMVYTDGVDDYLMIVMSENSAPFDSDNDCYSSQ